MDQMQPGDVITYYSDASHVGLYIGDGMIVHASTYGIPVAVVPGEQRPDLQRPSVLIAPSGSGRFAPADRCSSALVAESVVAAACSSGPSGRRRRCPPAPHRGHGTLQDLRPISLGGRPHRCAAGPGPRRISVPPSRPSSGSGAPTGRARSSSWPPTPTREFVAQAHLDPRRQWTDIAAVSVADDVDVARRQVVRQRIVLAPGASAMSDSALRIVLAHELFHFAARADTALDAPRWLTEGVADFVARPPAPATAECRASSPALPSDCRPRRIRLPAGRPAMTGRGGSPASSPTPTASTACVASIVRPAAQDTATSPTAVREALGIDLTELQARWGGG